MLTAASGYPSMSWSVLFSCVLAVVTADLAAQALPIPGVISHTPWRDPVHSMTAHPVVGPHLPDHQEQQSPRQLLQNVRPYVVAHRGASGPLPEHTAPAYLMAIAEGADFIECDVVVTRDLQLICRHEPNLNDTTDAWERFGDRATSYVIDGELVQGIFAADLTLAEVKQLRAKQRWAFRDHSFDGRYDIVTFEEFMDIALAARRPVGIYPEAKHPTWHNQLPAMQAAHTTLEQLMVSVLHTKGYQASAPYGSPAWRRQPIFIQSFEVTCLRRLSALTPVPLALLLDKGTAPDTGLAYEQVVSESYLAQLSPFVTVVAPWKAMFYTLVEKKHQAGNVSSSSGLVLPASGAAASHISGTDNSRRLLVVGQTSGSQGLEVAAAAGFAHPDVPMSTATAKQLQSQQLVSTGLAARLHEHGFQVHTYTLRDEAQFVLPTCKNMIACEFEWLFDYQQLDGAFADWPGTMAEWVQHKQAVTVG